jgi:hypothetical protein
MIDTGRAARPYVALAMLAGIATALTSRFAFPDGTLDLDEVSYQAQANALRARHLTLPRGTFDPFFRPFLSGVRGDRVVFKYQPVWPAVLSASDAVFHSTVPVRMALSAAGVLAVVWFARELLGDRRIAIIAGALVVASPFTWVQSASLLGYQLSLVLGTAAGAALLRAVRTKSRWAVIGAGVLLGLAVMHRPFDAVLAALPVLAYAGWRARRENMLARLSALVAMGAAPFGALMLAYNAAVMGSPLRLPFGVTGNVDRFGFGWRASFSVPGGGHEGQVNYTLGLAASTLGRVLEAFPRFLVAAPVVLVLAAAIVWLRRRDSRAWLLVAMVALPMVGYLFWWGTANAFEFHLEHALGPFYHYLLLPPLCIAAAWGAATWRPTRRIGVGLAIVAVAWTAVFSAVVWRDARDMGSTRSRDVAAGMAPGRRLILEAPSFPRDPYVRVANDARLRGEKLVAVDIPGRRLELIDRFPDRRPYAVRSFHRADDPFGPELRDRVPLRVTRGHVIRMRLHATVPAGWTATSYLRIGAGPRRLESSGARTIIQSWLLDPSRFGGGRSSAPVIVAVGITVTSAAVAPAAMTPEWFECRFEARLWNGGVEALTPCQGYRGYRFPNGARAVLAEDVSEVLQVGLHPVTR